MAPPISYLLDVHCWVRDPDGHLESKSTGDWWLRLLAGEEYAVNQYLKGDMVIRGDNRILFGVLKGCDYFTTASYPSNWAANPMFLGIGGLMLHVR